MKMIPKRFAMALLMVASAVFSLNSHAATIDLGKLGVGDTELDISIAFGSIADTWKFEVTETGKLVSGFAGIFGIASLSADISGTPFASVPSPLPLLSPVLLGPSIVLSPGMYSISVTGTTGTGFFPIGGYIGAVGLTAVPLPAPVLLLGSAMLGLVGFARRRRA
ncbi:MAG TPA: hypothetical protein PLH04_05725 [Pseudomonadales bacterium]|nr:hypothetical protein [Pseudomonadales bacterium]HNH19412.1 hypothetical protein [Pseudomonadales bacterium]